MKTLTGKSNRRRLIPLLTLTFKKPPGRLSGRKLISAFFTLTLLLLHTAAALADSTADEGKSFRVTGFGEVLFNDDHNSEGFLAPLSNGNILLIFRLDPGMEGNHVGTNGYIAQITYFPEEDRWGDMKSVYSSHKYDDRNIHGGVTRDGRIVVFFRHLYQGAGERYTEGRYFIYSDDDGATWSSPMKSATWSDPDLPDKRFGVWGTGQMFFNEDSGRYSMLGYGRHVTYITYSSDGKSWEEINPVREDPDAALTEIAGAWTGNNTLIALIRDDARAHGHPLLQTVSRDNGATWTEPVRTNIPYGMHWGCAPQLVYDQKRDLLIGVTSDRYSRENEKQSLFLYSARPEEVLEQPENWTLEFELLRPWATDTFNRGRPLNHSFYGYPTIVPIDDNEYLIVFTERATMQGSEQADLYYFRLVLE